MSDLYALPGQTGINRSSYHYSKKQDTMPSWNEKLIKAAREGRLTDLKLSIEKGADLEYRDENEYTPLLQSVYHGHIETVQYLVSVGSNKEAKTEIPQQCPFYSTCFDVGNVLMLQIGSTPLSLAAEKGHLDIVKYLIRVGCIKEARANDAFTPLLNSVYYGHIETVQYLVSVGSNKEATAKDGNTPLFIAVHKGNLQIVQYLITVGCQRDARDNDDFTPLLFAVQGGHIEIVKYLVTAQCDIEATNKDDFTPLLVAVRQGYLDIVKYLIKANCDIEARTKMGLTPLLVATAKGHLSIVLYLITVGCIRETKSKDGRTALHFSAKYGHFQVTKVLIEEVGISPFEKTYQGKTPYQLAAKKNRKDSTEKRQEKKEIMDYLKIVMSTENQNVSSKNPQQKGLLKVSKGPKEEILIFSDKEFKGLLMSGAYRCFWNRIFLTGPFGVGKTSLAKILVGDEAPEERQSTDGIWIYLGRAGMDIQERCWIFLKHGTILNATVQSLLRSKEVTATVGADKSVNDKEDLDTVKQSEETKNQDVVTSIPDAGEVTHSGNKSKPGALKSQENIPQKAFKGRTPSHIFTQNDRGGKMEETKIEENLTGIDMSEEEIIKLVRSQCTLGQYEMEVVPIDLWDFGGQKIYHLTHQLFVTSRGTFLLIFNGSRDIHENIPEYTELPGCQGQRNTAVYLIHWVNSVLTYCKTIVENKEYPKILCVATHKDLVKGDVEEQRTSLENSIEELFQNHGGKQHLQYKPLIFVNARNKEDEEIATLKKQLVDVALDHPRCGELMPTKFVPLELQLARNVEENKKILTMDELNDINKQNDKIALTSAQLKSFLKVNHALGKLIYFDEAGLRDNVIIDPVFLVDVLRSIVTDDQFWPEHLKEILKSLKESGKLLKKDLYKIWKQDCFREIWAHKDYIVDMLVHLDIMCRPKDDEDGSDFFLVPCMISTKREDNQQIDHDRSIHLAYRFKEEVVPPAILYRFIATFISIWKLRVSAKSNRLMIFTDSADVKIDGDHDMRFDIQGNRFIVTLSHKEKNISIVPSIASTVQECLTHAIINISNFYFSVSEDSACDRDLPFTIQIGIPCGRDLCFFDHILSSKGEWKCPDHNTKHKTKLVSKWFADKLHTEHDRCPQDCSGLDKVWLDRQPEDKHLGRLASKLTHGDTRTIYMMLKKKEPALQWDIINESNKREKFYIKLNALYDWKKSSKYVSFKQLQNSLEEGHIDIHKLCQISREVQTEMDQPRDKLLLRPSDSNIQQLPDHIGSQTFQLGIELGLSVVEMQKIESNHVTNLHGQTEEVLKRWIRIPEATFEALGKALHRIELSSVLSYLTYDEELGGQMEIEIDEHVRERIIQDIQISQIVDYMMTHLVISSDDRRRIEHHAGQDDQNKALLREVIKRGEPTYTVFIDALQKSGYTDLANELKSDGQEEGSSAAIVQTGNIENKGLSDWIVPMYKVRLQKNYSKIIDNIQHEAIVDHLISRDVLTIAESQMINACPAQIQKNRKLMDILLHGSEHVFIEFIKALREDSVYAELADKIENTAVASRDISTFQSCFK
ncbi:uncharacterized protein LOC134719283 [Mytilus trossulus]|uniref:uncharacterized protein LOC134719283 n=1 Tax=Mytilus trossulus TaxID=6551 RepID=UPI0030070C08